MMQLAVSLAGESRLFTPGEVVTIGRDPDSTVVLTDPSVASTHAFLRYEADGWVLHDRSGVGTFVNGTRVRTMPVHKQAVVGFGSTTGAEVSVLPVSCEERWANVPDLGPTTRVSDRSGGSRSIFGSLASMANATPPLAVVLPLKAWWESKEWQKGYPLLLLSFGLVPWVILHAVNASTTEVGTVAWGFSIYFAALWALFLWALVRPGRIEMGLVAKVAIASAAVGAPLAIGLERHFGATSSLSDYTLGVGFPEELAKALPVFVFMFLAQKRYTTRMYLYMGAVSGLAFGALEAVNYTRLAASHTTTAAIFMTFVVWRLLTDGLFHACAAGISCYFIGLASRNPRWRVQLTGFGLGLVAVIHGMSDRYSEGWLQVGIAGALLFIFLGYVMTGDTIEHDVSAIAPHETLPLS